MTGHHVTSPGARLRAYGKDRGTDWLCEWGCCSAPATATTTPGPFLELPLVEWLGVRSFCDRHADVACVTWQSRVAVYGAPGGGS